MKGVFAHIILPEKLKKELQEEAEQRNLSLSSYIKMLLTERKK